MLVQGRRESSTGCPQSDRKLAGVALLHYCTGACLSHAGMLMHLGKSDKHCTALQDAVEAPGILGQRGQSLRAPRSAPRVYATTVAVYQVSFFSNPVKRILHRHRWAVDQYQCRSGRMAPVGNGGEAMKNPSCGLGRDKPIPPR